MPSWKLGHLPYVRCAACTHTAVLGMCGWHMGKSTVRSRRVSSPRRVGSAPRPFGWPLDGLDDDDHISYNNKVQVEMRSPAPLNTTRSLGYCSKQPRSGAGWRVLPVRQRQPAGRGRMTSPYAAKALSERAAGTKGAWTQLRSGNLSAGECSLSAK